jgi:hypothetical protein
MNGKDFVEDMRKIGLSEYDAKVYWILKINGGWLKALQISNSAEIPQSKIYDTLQRLMFKGLVKESNTIVTTSGYGMGWISGSGCTLKQFLEMQRKAKKLGYFLKRFGGHKRQPNIGRANIKIYKALKLDKFLNKKLDVIEKVKGKYGIL